VLAIAATSQEETAVYTANPCPLSQLDSLNYTQFQFLLTLFSEFFSTFPHSTCLLSDSRIYLALDAHYHQICT